MTPNPLALIAEVTHRCPLHCVYCSNPLQMVAKQAELSTDEWVGVFQQASRLGVPRPSTVVISSPSCASAKLRQESTRLPFTCTVHAPHCP